MTAAEIESIIMAICFGSLGGILVVCMWLAFRIEDRDSTKRGGVGSRPGQRFHAQSRWGKSNDMLADETHPSRQNKE